MEERKYNNAIKYWNNPWIVICTYMELVQIYIITTSLIPAKFSLQEDRQIFPVSVYSIYKS